MTSGAGRENISVLATCCTDRHALDPLIIFSEINFQSTCRGKNPLRDTLYGISRNGWMTTEIFALWFENFVKQVKKRPLLVVYDGHLTHVSLNLIKKAMEERITIVKLPPHVNDKLQPLDVCCFGPLKRKWKKKNWMRRWICLAWRNNFKINFCWFIEWNLAQVPFIQ